MRKWIMTAFAVLTAGMIGVWGASAQAAAPHHADPCKVGFRGQPAYDAKCLRTGKIGDAAGLWYSTPEGKEGKERDDYTTRRNICKYAYRSGGVRAAAADLVNDMAYDTYRNYRQINAWVGTLAQGDCLRLGYADRTTGLVSVNLKHLPSRACWYEVSYLGRDVNVEPLCRA